MDRPNILQLHRRIVENQVREVRVHHQTVGLFQHSLQRDFTVGLGVPVGLFHVQRAQKERIKVDIPDLHVSLDRKGIGEADSQAAGNFSIGHRRTEGEPGQPSVGCQATIEAANHRLTDLQVHDPERPLCLRRRCRTASLQAERYLAIHRGAR